MTRSRWRLAALCVVLAVPAVAAPPPSPAAVAAATSELRIEVDRLRQEVATLRDELAALRREAPASDVREARLSSAEQRLQALEGTVAALGERLAILDERGGRVDDALDAVDRAEERRVHLGVYGNMVAEDRVDEGSRFAAESFELVLSGRPHARLGFFAEIELENAAAVGGARGGEVLLEQAWASYTISPLFNLRAGVLLVPFGNVSGDHYAPNRDVVSKPLTSLVVAPSDWTDNGLGVYGRGVLGGDWVLAYEALVGAGLDAHLDAFGTRGARQPFGVDNNNDKAVSSRLSLRRGQGFELGLSGYRGKYDDASRLLLAGWAVDAHAALGPVLLTGEWNRLAAARATAPDARFEGWYARAVWSASPAWLHAGALGASFPEGKLALVAQYDRVRLRGPLAGSWLDQEERRWTWGLNYRPSHEWVLKIDYERSRASRLRLVNGDSQGWVTAIGFVF